MAKRWLGATTLLLLLAACTPTQERPTVTVPPTPPISLAVGSIEAASAAQYPASLNFIARRRSEALAQDAQTFLRSHLIAAGGADFARATVEEATLIERARPTNAGVLATATEPNWEMVGVLALKVAIVDGLGIEQSFASSRVEIKRTISQRASVDAKEDFARAITSDLIAAASRELETSIDENLTDRRIR
jgi:hypothetical protein